MDRKPIGIVGASQYSSNEYVLIRNMQPNPGLIPSLYPIIIVSVLVPAQFHSHSDQTIDTTSNISLYGADRQPPVETPVKTQPRDLEIWR